MNYRDISPIERRIEADRQGAKRHYGVHPYFTRRPYNVVSQYILHYSKEKDRILDPFGGSGVTAIEAFLNNRIGIQNDINPLANFIAKGIANLAIGNLHNLVEGLSWVIGEIEPQIAKAYQANGSQPYFDLSNLPLPEDIQLPSNSDVKNYRELFSERQLFSLSLLKRSIDSIDDKDVRDALLLAWSASLAKLNKTFLSAEGRVESRGGSSIFSIYRYKVAKSPVELHHLETFRERAQNIINAKAEILKIVELRNRQGGWHGRFETFSEDVEDLADRFKGSIDYIFTDPPYGGHISYLDLSVLWNNWLGQMPSDDVRRKEVIVGGELRLSDNHYLDRLRSSIKCCLKMLKSDRWISVVFQHWNIRYFQAILDAARECGGELCAAVSQVGDPIWSMHKKKNKDSVLAGEMILTFFKGKRKAKAFTNKVFDLEFEIDQMLEAAGDKPVYGEYLFNQIVLAAWHASSIDELNLSKTTLSQLLEDRGWHYDKASHVWTRSAMKSLTLF